MRLKKSHILIIFGVALLLIDQISKIWIKTNMQIGDSIPVFGSWFQILFIENKGMAFGMQFGGDIGKILLTTFRMVLLTAIIVYIRRLVFKQTPMLVLMGLTLVAVGALGNIVDSVFYGILFGESTMSSVATFLPEGGGYAPLFMGKVVDMLYFPIIDTVLPEWVPFKGGERFVFFSPIFNIADSCISIGAVLLAFRWKALFPEDKLVK